jgi:hypothetical protein
MAGFIATHFHENEPEFKLPGGSIYAPIENIIAGWASGKSKAGEYSAEQCADAIIPDILGTGKGGTVWRGPHAGEIEALAYWLPSWCQDSAMSYNQGFKELTVSLASNEQE